MTQSTQCACSRIIPLTNRVWPLIPWLCCSDCGAAAFPDRASLLTSTRLPDVCLALQRNQAFFWGQGRSWTRKGVEMRTKERHTPIQRSAEHTRCPCGVCCIGEGRGVMNAQYERRGNAEHPGPTGWASMRPSPWLVGSIDGCLREGVNLAPELFSIHGYLRELLHQRTKHRLALLRRQCCVARGITTTGYSDP